MESKIFFEIGDKKIQKLVIKFEDCVPTFTIGEDKLINITYYGKAYIQKDNCSDQWEGSFAVSNFPNEKKMVVKFKDETKSIKIFNSIFSWTARITIKGLKGNE